MPHMTNGHHLYTTHAHAHTHARTHTDQKEFELNGHFPSASAFCVNSSQHCNTDEGRRFLLEKENGLRMARIIHPSENSERKD